VIEIAVEDGVCTVTLSRPERPTALTTEGLESLRSAIDRATQPVLVIRGAGEVFCAGADLAEVERLTPADAPDFAALGQKVARVLSTYDGATVAAIDGPFGVAASTSRWRAISGSVRRRARSPPPGSPSACSVRGVAPSRCPQWWAQAPRPTSR
jgi:hypothetical protein